MKAGRMRSRRRSTKHIRLDTGKCKACWKCIEECKYGALGYVNLWFHKHVVVRDPEKCRGCKRCIAVCPNGVFEAAS
jgi:ferredoxin